MAMPEGIDRALIDHVAQLSSLSLTQAEKDKLTREVAGILKYVGELGALDTSNVPPTAQVVAQPAATALRPDEVHPGLSHEDAIAQAPRASQGGFAVPAFIEETATKREAP
jgi:aspartyl-tRNA(Asn)/glutamyl-tRNA(Gln) amidotransferase subunit C